MNIDFTNEIIKMKEREVLHKPFPTPEGPAIFEKNEDKIIKMVFSNEEAVSKYLNHLGYNWGNEGKNEFKNFDSLNRLLNVFPELKDAEVVAADPQWDANALPVTEHEKQNLHESTRNMEDMPHIAVELREVDHPLHWDESNYDTKADECKDCKDKVGIDYSELYKKVKGEEAYAPKGMPWAYAFEVGDKVRNVNEECMHHQSEGTVEDVKELPNNMGNVIGYMCSNAGNNWVKGDVLYKTPDQLEKLDQTGAPMNRPWAY